MTFLAIIWPEAIKVGSFYSEKFSQGNWNCLKKINSKKYKFLSTENQEKFYLYIIISVASGVLLLLSLVIGRLLVSRHRAKRDAKFQANNETLPNGFTDDISEIDADIDLTTPVPVPMQDTR